ncbi:carboxyl-terminal processing protease [Dulcicalothrix desertica PCC 7102]|uniref:Carboxyl-terminal processing protease n=2 Tax=Dulcicalothrix desertica TaxID=32056 RepID=A0A433US73_9CYAN|nr:carboxyl-terminal processing protease [Dulcicalothrix desertica PCC 7102]
MLTLWLASPLLPTLAQPQARVFDEVWQTINDNFYDPKFNGINWQAMRDKYKPQAIKSKSSQEFAAVVNQMLAELRTSHTRFYTPDEQSYYQLLGIFQPRDRKSLNRLKPFFSKGKFEYTDIGIFTKAINGKTFVSAILDESPAIKAGIKVGDEILSVNNQPYQPVQSFAPKAGQKVTIQIQRTADTNSKQEIVVTPKVYDATTMFLDAQRVSTQIIERQNKKIGYVHIWANAADPSQEKLIYDLLYDRLKDADALILDLRAGWGGGNNNYLTVFTGQGPSITSIARNGSRVTYDSHWKKPVVILINEGSRSSKEIIAYGFQQYKIGSVIGTKTLGAVVAGRPFIMQDGTLLYVAVTNVFVNGTRLEGKGVTPDITVPFTLEYAQGADPQKEKAIEVVLSNTK